MAEGKNKKCIRSRYKNTTTARKVFIQTMAMPSLMIEFFWSTSRCGAAASGRLASGRGYADYALASGDRCDALIPDTRIWLYVVMVQAQRERPGYSSRS